MESSNPVSTGWQQAMKYDSLSLLLRDQRGVTAAVAVVLMLALTVILAAVAVPLVFSQSDQIADDRPDVDLAFAYTEDVDPDEPDHLGTDWSDDVNGTLTIVFESGESVPASQLNISSEESSGNLGLSDEFDRDDVTAGTQVTVFTSRGDTVQVRWESPDGEESSILGEFTIRPLE